MILSIDPSLSSTGYAVLDDDYTLITCGKITTKKNNKIDKYEDEDNRIFHIVNTIENELLFKFNKINAVAMEAQFKGKSAKTVMQLSRLRGALTYCIKNNNIPVRNDTPSFIRKNLMGKGNASKEEIADFISAFYSNNQMVKDLGPFNDKQCKDKNSDIYDAIGIGIAYLNFIKGQSVHE